MNSIRWTFSLQLCHKNTSLVTTILRKTTWKDPGENYTNHFILKFQPLVFIMHRQPPLSISFWAGSYMKKFEIVLLLESYTLQQMGPKGCPETSVTNYQSMLNNIPEQQRPHLHHSGNLKSNVIISPHNCNKPRNPFLILHCCWFTDQHSTCHSLLISWSTCSKIIFIILLTTVY